MAIVEKERGEVIWDCVREVPPSELYTPSFYYELGLVDLVNRAYRLDNDTEANKLYFAMREYTAKKGDIKKTNFMAFKAGKAIGSISIHKLFPQETELGKFFWKYLDEEDAALCTKALKFPMACFIEGVITDPDCRGKGVGKELYNIVVKQLQPAFVLGDTRTPEAVISLASALKQDYRTFWHTWEVTPNPPQKDVKTHLPVIEANLKTYQYTVEDGIWYADVSALPYEEDPRIESFPKYIQEPLEHISKAQKEAGEGRTATMVMLAVRKELL